MTLDDSYEALDKISRFYASHGATSLLITTISNPIEKLAETIQSIKNIMRRGVSGSEIIGVHIEGPLLQP